MEHSYYRTQVKKEQIIDSDKLENIYEEIEKAERLSERCIFLAVLLTTNERTYLKLYGYQYSLTSTYTQIYW